MSIRFEHRRQRKERYQSVISVLDNGHRCLYLNKRQKGGFILRSKYVYHEDAMREWLKAVGLKTGYFIDKLGYSRSNWHAKINGLVRFNATDVAVLRSVGMTDEWFRRIFG